MAITIEYPKEVYTLVSTSRGGLPAIVVVNEALVSFDHRALFAWHLSVEIIAQSLGENGMPTVEESEALDEVGDAIHGVALEGRNALFLARITNDGRREQLYRVHDPKCANAALSALADRPAQRREWTFTIVGDGEWELADPILRLLRDAKVTN